MSRRSSLRILLVSVLLVAIARPCVAAPLEEGQGTYLGILFGPVVEALYDQLPQLPRQHGVLVTRVLPESPAATADLHRHDIILNYDGQAIRDCEHLARLIRDDKPGRKLKLTYLRAGRTESTAVTLSSGPALKLAGPQPAATEARGTSRAGGPTSVNVTATPLDNGRLKVKIEYYPDGSDRPRTISWEGEAADLDSAARSLPERERQLARRALDRFRTLSTSKTPAEPRPPS
jgi:hypothetical protein